MARTVKCRRYGEELEGLERPPLPGSKGQDIFDHVSKKAWLEWQGHQTMLINEKHLSLMDPEARNISWERWKNSLLERILIRPKATFPPIANAVMYDTPSLSCTRATRRTTNHPTGTGL